MAERQDSQQQYGFTVVQLFKNDTLGTGSYGAVCKAKCDQLLCAAKLLYPVLFQMQDPDPGKEHRRPFRRFEEECEFLSRINHPNIVQYLGTYHDPETNNPVLLMELMDESLTHFLESSPGDLPYHTQVNLSYDIAQALAFLHSNGIIHRDLSSNNVLLLASNRAKVTDFGMSKFTDPRLATMTKCPGTPAFMSPEALNEPPVYTEKLDNFSFGVLLIQITTRQFPKPTDRFKMREVLDPRLGNQVIQANVPVPELERRQAHINLIPPDHPLLLIAHNCIKDNDSERPTATDLCQSLTTLKRMDRYQESSQQDPYQLLREKDSQIQSKDEQLLANQAELAQKDTQLEAKENTIAQKNEQLQAKDRELDQATQDNHILEHEVGAREEQLKAFKREWELSEENCAALQQTIQQREQTIQQQDKELSELKQVLASKNEKVLTIRMHHVALQDKRQARVGRWKSLPDTPANMDYGSSAVIGEKIYFKPYDRNTVYEFKNKQQMLLSRVTRWNELPPCPNFNCTIVNVDNIPTTVGGGLLSLSNKLYSYINNQWVEHFPPMPTERSTHAVVYANNTLVVAGGYSDGWLLTTVEILNTANRQWSSVSSLPVEMNNPSTTICEDYVYIHPRTRDQEKNSVYKCSLEQLVQSKPSSDAWEKISSLPVSYSSLVTVNDNLLAVGGLEADNHTINIYEYRMKLWTIVGHMTSPRSTPTTAVLPGNKLMVVGGHGAPRKCELATAN